MAETVYLHGWGLHGGIWEATRSVLPGVAPDLPGYGNQAAPAVYTAETLADQLAERIDHPVNLVGWSMGGMVALALAARYSAKVEKLVLVGSSPAFVNRDDWHDGLAPEVVAGFASDLSRDYRGTLLRFLSLQARGGDAPRDVVSRLREAVFARGEPDARVLASGMELLRSVDLRQVVKSVVCPVLVVHGAYDALCPVAAGDWLASHLPQARLAVHERASHAPFISHPEWFHTQVEAFLHG